VNGVSTRFLGCLDDRLLVEVRLAGRCGADVVRLVGVFDVPAVAVGVAVDGDGVDSEFLAGGHDANSDLPPVCDE